MKKINLMLSFGDSEYAEALARALTETDRRFVVTVGETDRLHSFDGIVVHNAGSDISGDNVIFADSFITLRELTELVSMKAEALYGDAGNSGIPTNVSLITVTGSSGGAGVTSVAEGLAQELTVYYGYKVCIVSLESFPEDESRGIRTDVRRLLYKVLTGNNNPESNIMMQDYFIEDEYGVYHLDYGAGINMLSLSDVPLINRFLKYIADAGVFNYIILDIPCEKITETVEIIEASAEIILVNRGEIDNTGCRKVKKYVSEILEENYDRIITVDNNNYFKILDESEEDISDSSEKCENAKTTKIRAEFDEEMFKTGKIRVDGIFGMAIKNIAQRLTFC